jgi:hypothetical protein
MPLQLKGEQRVPSELSQDQLSHLTRLGARIRLAEIKQERVALMAILNGAAKAVRPTRTTSASAEPVRHRRRRAKWTAAQRQAVSERMTKYWAAKRAGRKK